MTLKPFWPFKYLWCRVRSNESECFFELRMNKSEIKLLFILLIWELWMVNYSPKGIHFHEFLRALLDIEVIVYLVNHNSFYLWKKTVLILESDSLDLSGPFYVGGVDYMDQSLLLPPQVWSASLKHGFVGCLKGELDWNQ